MLDAIREIGIFMIAAQAVVHFEPGRQYEKYIKSVSGIVMLLLFLKPVLQLAGAVWEEPQALKPRFRYELEDGIIKSVSFEIDYNGKEENTHYRDEVTCAALAWEGGKWKSKMRMMMSDRLLRLEDEIQESGCGNYKAYDIRQDIVELYRYEEKDGGFYPQMSGEDGRLHIVFEMGEKIRE